MRKNILYLYLVQISNYVIPILTLPYLLRVLGADGFGKLMLSQALIQYLILITDFGFNFSATKKIAQSKNQKEIDKIYTNTLTAKIILLALCFIVYAISACFIELFDGIRFVTSILFLMVIGNVFYPIFLFQGIERMKSIAWVSIVSKIFMFIGLILFVHHENDLLSAALVFAVGGLLPAAFSLSIIKKKQYVKYNGFKLRKGIKELKDSWPLFISQISITFYSTFNIILLGYLFTPTVVGYYAAADKLRNAVQSIFQPVQQVVFPRINKERNEYKNNIMKFGLAFVLFSFFIALSIFFLGKPISLVYFGSAYETSATLFKWMSILVLVISVAIVVAQWGLISCGYERVLTKIYIFGAVIHLCYSPFIVKTYGIYSMLGCVIFTETIVTMLMITFFISKWKDIK
ncbi:flippase [Citrobacter sp. NCU1]|uniref:flippase n=1 Tax=Citrobacter sp. NCU1 TaxID=2026683 RepID=UPI001390E8A7|nr:flippase [Citrobacter sp. NCU1]NDO80328.1 flippase [Citrobacter sp. NCU1]